jgi:hypothetical protein
MQFNKVHPKESRVSRSLFFAALCSLVGFLGCGGGGGGNHTNMMGGNTIAGSASNVATITVNGGTQGLANGLFVAVTVCFPGSTTNCATVPNVLVDTGSTGLRILSDALPVGFSLQQQNDAGGNPIAECTLFGDGFTWGPVQNADMTISGEKASAMPVQVIMPSFPASAAPPASCSSKGGPAENTTAAFGAQGVLGVNNFPLDCGSACAPGTTNNPGLYYTCPASGCVITTQALNQQLPHPGTLFATDKNGVIIELPPITSATGMITATGALVFGIGTQSNNGLNGANILTTDAIGNFTTTFLGNPVPNSFTDSGSTVLFFQDSSITQCNLGTPPAPFFCPASTASLSATLGTMPPINFTVANAQSLFATNNFAFNNIGAPITFKANMGNGGFDWGVPFFYGRNVFVAIDGASTPGGTGPYIAF